MSRNRKQKNREKKEEKERKREIIKQRIGISSIDFRSSVRDLPEGIGKEGDNFLRFQTCGQSSKERVGYYTCAPTTIEQEGTRTSKKDTEC